ncbi:MAG: TetR/AcrR family transcriptional regulator [Clostridia bacterium]|nr:TetR/AcrR family transcriptional regulator [Clostridia bacterium]
MAAQHEKIREALVANAIHLIAVGGFEKATTRELTHYGSDLLDFKMNESYIYRLFGSKEDLYEKAFDRLDHELFYAFRRGVEAVGGFEGETKQRLYEFFLRAWGFILGNEERCRCYVRYYYSVYFKGNSLRAHRKLFKGIVSEMTPIFKEEADVEAILHSIFTALFDFAIRVYNGDLRDDDINRPHIFNVLYCMMMTYLKDPVKAS